MEKPKISVVFPVYNEAYIIERTITSYYNELKGKIDFEMIVAEDGSTDGTKEILKRLKKELTILEKEVKKRFIEKLGQKLNFEKIKIRKEYDIKNLSG